MQCMDGLMLRGFVDHRGDIECVAPNYILLAAAIVLVSIIGFKFLAALQLGSKRLPENHEKFVICQVPCYTEGEQSLLRTINALALLDYDDKRKLLFVICDGNFYLFANTQE
jgi:chitin synthase